jgi:isoamylase
VRTRCCCRSGYAQDNPMSWFDWNLDEDRRQLLEFTRGLIALRQSHPNLHRRKFFQDRPIDPDAPERVMDKDREPDIHWFRTDGKEMGQEEWHAGWICCIGMLLNGRTLDDLNALGEPLVDDTFLILLNPHHEPIRFSLPPPRAGMVWELVLDTRSFLPAKTRKDRIARSYQLVDRSMVVFVEAPQAAARRKAGALTREEPAATEIQEDAESAV